MSGKLTLFEDDSNGSGDEEKVELKVNKGYAKSYDQWREKELLQRYKDLQEEISSSSSESEEEDPEINENFFRVLSLLKGQDPKIYDKNFVAFKESETEPKNKSTNIKKEKPVSIKDYERKIALEMNGDASEEDDIPDAKTMNEKELAKLKSAIMDDDDDAEDEECIKSLNPSKPQTTEEEETEGYIQFLKGSDADIPDDSKKDLSYLRSCWNDPNLDEDEKFLRDFFLNKTYLKKDEDFKVMEELEKLSEDDNIEEEQELFEHKYNFRFEEPDPDFIKRYPRTVGDSLRRKDSRRKAKREDYTERKQHEKEQKREELKRLKSLKRKEIEDKFLKLQEITGKEDLNLDENDIESEFDPDKHDQKMKELFNDEFYSVEEQQKPEFTFDEEIDEEDWNHWSREKSQNTVQIDDESKDENYSDDAIKTGPVSEFEREMTEYSQDRKKRGKKKSLFAKIISNPKPLYDPDGKSFDDYLEEYYRMDCEDIIGNLPVRFKYRKVIPNNFGLTVDEILKADDKDLNKWCSIKKTCQYRQEEEEKYDVQAFHKKAEIPSLKQKIIPSLYAEPAEEKTNTDQNNSQDSKPKRKKKRSKKNKAENQDLKSTDEKLNLNNSESSPELDALGQNDVKKGLNDGNTEKLSKSQKKRLRKENANKNIAMGSSVQEESDTAAIENVSERESSPQKEQDISQNTSNRKRKRSRKDKIKDVNMSTNITIEDNGLDTNNKMAQFGDVSIATLLSGDNIKSKKMKLDISSSKELDNSSNLADNSDDNDPDVSTSILPSSDNLKHKKSKRKLEVSSDEKVSNNGLTQIESQNTSVKLELGNSSNAETGKRKRKRKKNKKKNDLNENSQSKKPVHLVENRFNKETDKRLALSNERLAAYGINPKKFKNMIKYSK